MFLRADRFHVPTAAKRMALYFQLKMELFGPALLVQKITFDDLSEDDQDALMKISVFFFGKDQSGRAVFLDFLRFYNFQTVDSWVRICILLFEYTIC
jgi:hypothetical protein